MKKSLIVLLSAIIAVNVSGCKKSSDKMRENTDSSKTYEIIIYIAFICF